MIFLKHINGKHMKVILFELFFTNLCYKNYQAKRSNSAIVFKIQINRRIIFINVGVGRLI